MNSLYLEIGKRLKQRREEMSLTQSKVAELLHMSLNFYGCIERGKSKISLEKIILVYEKMGIDPTYLLIGSRSKIDKFEILQDCPEAKISDVKQILHHLRKLY